MEKCVDIEQILGVEIFSPGVSRKRKLVIDLSISFNLWSITPTDLSGGVSRGGFCTERSGVQENPPLMGISKGRSPLDGVRGEFKHSYMKTTI